MLAQDKSNFSLSKNSVQLEVGDYTAIYHRLFGGLTLLDKKSKLILDSFTDNKKISSDILKRDPLDRYEDLIQQLALRKLIEPTEKEAKNAFLNDIQPNNKITVIQLIMANACNFGCTYCFEGVQGQELSVSDELNKLDESRIIAKDSIKIDINDSMYASKERFAHQYDPKNRHMKAEDGIAYVEKSLDIAMSSGVNEVMIQFFGGEPLLNWKTIKAILNHFEKEYKGIKIHYSTVTNGSLISNEVSELFAKYNVAVCVSVDSPSSPSRPLKNGDDSMPTVMDGLRKLQKNNNRVALNSALTSATWDDFNNQIVDLALEVGAKEIGVVVDFDPTFYKAFGTKKIVDHLWSVIEYGRLNGVVLTGYWHQIFQVMLGFNTISERGFKNCSAKGAQLSIEPNGSVFSCKAGSTQLGHIDEKQNLLASDNYIAHANLRNNNPEFCNGCEIEGFCAGLCLGSLEKKYGSLDSVEPDSCDFYRAITRKHIESLKPNELATFEY